MKTAKGKAATRRQAQQDWMVMGGIVLAASIGATQFVAERFHYHPALGAPWLDHLYAPWSWLVWQTQFEVRGPQTFALVRIAFILILGGMVYAYLTILSMRQRSLKAHTDTHGTAHFASQEEIEESGLLTLPGEKGAGVYVGGWMDSNGKLHYLRHDGPEHIAAIAPTRSGKGVGLVVPTLLTWPHSALIHDMKGELWNLTAGYRKAQLGGVVLKFDPAAAEGSCAFNPLQAIRRAGDNEVGDVQNLVSIIVDPDGKGLNDHWMKTAHAFITGLILYLLHTKAGQANLFDVALSLSDPQHPVDRLYEAMLANTHPNPKTRMVIAAAARDMTNRPEAERGSVLSTAMSFLALYRDPLVARNISHSDFAIQDLMNHVHPVSLYLVVRPADKDRLKPLMRLLLNQIVRLLTGGNLEFKNGLPDPQYQHRLLLMLDEFPSFGKLEVFQESLAFIAGYGLKAYLIMQDIAQLQAAYGPNESIISNCHIRIAYAPNNYKTAEWLSNMLGQITVSRKETTVSGKRLGGLLKNVSESMHTSARPLMTPDEVMRLPGPKKNKKTGQIERAGEMLIFTGGGTPIRGTQILYFRDPWFQKASQIQPPTGTDTLQARIPWVNAVKVELSEPQEATEAQPEPESNDPERAEQQQSIPVTVQTL
ncbi:type IV secretory system conjugative DNA transfer family protein [Vampirovibrio sp.]|uniref:type IV secretory system conjugative DNA transfer family protein n=1 Tax=Vampirovibrio sp. TaxID=2717857 RepID=UPI0035939BAE